MPASLPVPTPFHVAHVRRRTFSFDRATKQIMLALLAAVGAAACTDEPTVSPRKVVPDHPALTTGTGSAIAVTPLTMQTDSTVVGLLTYGVEYKVTNIGTTDLALSTMTTSGPARDDFGTWPSKSLTRCDFGTQAAKMAPGASCGAWVTFTPSDTGKRIGAWTFVAANGDTARMDLTGVGLRSKGTVTTTPAALDFGPQLVGVTSAARKVSITNTGNAAIAIYDIKASGVDGWEFSPVNVGSTSLCVDKPNLDPGSSCDAFVTFKPAMTGPASAWLTFRTDAGGIATSLTGTGVTSAPVLSVSPSTLAFATQVVGTSSTAQKVIVTNTGQENLTLSTTTLGGPNAADFKLTPYSTNLCAIGANIAPASSCELVVLFTPLADGTRAASLDIDSNGGKVSVGLSGTAILPVPVLSVSPTSLTFGTQDVGSMSTAQSVTISNTGTGALTLSALAVGGTNWTDFAIAGFANIGTGSNGGPCTLPLTIAVGDYCIAQISFKPTGTGTRSASMKILSDGGTASVTLSGTGVLPPADLAVSVGATPSPAYAGKPLTYTITMRNAGPSAAEGVQLIDVVPSTTTFASISAPADVLCVTPAVGGTGTVTCTMPAALPSNMTRTITLVVKVLSGGRSTVTNTASVTAKSPDPASLNNSATIVTTVYGRK